MTATGYTSTTGDPRKVDVAGDTMTGDLVLSDSTPDTDKSATTKEYVLAQVAGAGTGVASDTVVSETSFGQSATAGEATTYSRGDHTHGTPASGGGTSIRTASVRIDDGAVQDLTSTSSWIIAETSVGTDLKCSIAASAGDRIRVCGHFMRNGAHFLDWVLLDSSGNPSVYAASGTSSPLAEGNPAMYPSVSFAYVTGDDMFTVSAGHISAGNVTVALYHKGTSAGRVYCYSGYPFRLRLENIGAEPS